MAVIEMDSEQLNQALQSNKPIILDFWAPWCGPCLHFAPVYQRCSELYPDVIFGKINVEDHEDLAVKFKIRSIPKICIIRDGDIIAERLGSSDFESFKTFLESHLSV
ncbi:MAG: thioredoxin family protein [Gammaproteobacteria bacterium]|nr:thioredoxin family protein [Gammaproteobacteria bacterium]